MPISSPIGILPSLIVSYDVVMTPCPSLEFLLVKVWIYWKYLRICTPLYLENSLKSFVAVVAAAKIGIANQIFRSRGFSATTYIHYIPDLHTRRAHWQTLVKKMEKSFFFLFYFSNFTRVEYIRPKWSALRTQYLRMLRI